MNIDLFTNSHSECGILCDTPFEGNVAGVIFDASTSNLTIELGENGEAVHCNIPVEERCKEVLLLAHKMYVGSLEDGLISSALQVPMLYLNDPYGSSFMDKSPIAAASGSVLGFEQFMKRCDYSQALHRDDLGDESAAGCVLNSMSPKALEYVPKLLKQRALEAAPKLAPSAPAPNVPGMGMGGGAPSMGIGVPTLRPGGSVGAAPPSVRRFPVSKKPPDEK